MDWMWIIMFENNKAIAMMRGKYPPPEHVLEKKKSKNFKDLEREIIISFLSKCHFVVVIHVYFKTKTQQNKSLFNKIEMSHFYTSL